MGELKPVLERLRDGLEPAVEPDLPGVERRARTRGVRRRLAAGALAVVTAAAGVGVVIEAFDRREVSREATTPALDPRVAGTFQVGTRGQVSGIAAGFGSLWITAYGVPGGDGPDEAALLRFDPETERVEDVIPLTGVSTWTDGGGGVTVGSDSIWVTGGSAPIDGERQSILSRVDPVTLEVEGLVLGGQPGPGDVSESRTGVWVVGDLDKPALAHVDPELGKLIGPEVPLRGDTARQVVATDDAVMIRQWEWHGDRGPCGVLTSVDPRTMAVRAEEPAAGSCGGIGPIFRWRDEIWSTVEGGFARIDSTTALPTGPIHPFTEEFAFPRSEPVVDTTGVWFGAYPGGNGNQPDHLSRFDPESGAIETFDLDVGWVAAAALDGTIWALDFDGGLSRIDLVEPSTAPTPPVTRMTVTDVFTYGVDEVSALGQVVVDEDSVWVLELAAYNPRSDAAVLRLDPSSGRILSRTEVVGASDLTVLGDSVWVVRRGDGGGGWVTQIDRGSGVILGSIGLPGGISGSSIASYQGDLWVAVSRADGEDGLIRISPSRGEIVAEIPAPICTALQGGCYPNTELVGVGGAIWVAGSERGTTIRVDVESQQVSVLETGAVAGFAADEQRLWVAVQPDAETVSAARWWEGKLDLVPLDTRTGDPAAPPIGVAGADSPFDHAGVPFAVWGDDVLVWGLDAGGNTLVLARVGDDGSAAADTISLPDRGFLDGGRAVVDRARGVLWVAGALDLTRIELPSRPDGDGPSHAVVLLAVSDSRSSHPLRYTRWHP
jgi:hypothetical protein